MITSVTVGDDPFEMSILLRFSGVAARMSVTSGGGGRGVGHFLP